MKKHKHVPYFLTIATIVVSLLFVLTGCSPKATVSNAVMTTGVDEQSLPIDTATEFKTDTDIYVAAELHDAPDNTNITITWYSNGETLDSVTINNGQVSDAPIWCILPAESVTTKGPYSVEIYINDQRKPDTKTEFTVN